MLFTVELKQGYYHVGNQIHQVIRSHLAYWDGRHPDFIGDEPAYTENNRTLNSDRVSNVMLTGSLFLVPARFLERDNHLGFSLWRYPITCCSKEDHPAPFK